LSVAKKFEELLTHGVTVEQQNTVRVAVVFDAHVERMNAVVIRCLQCTHQYTQNESRTVSCNSDHALHRFTLTTVNVFYVKREMRKTNKDKQRLRFSEFLADIVRFLN